MFSIYETRENREELLNKLLDVDPCVALVIAFLDFEWTLRRRHYGIPDDDYLFLKIMDESRR